MHNKTNNTEEMKLTAHDICDSNETVYFEDDFGNGFSATFDSLDIKSIIEEVNAEDLDQSDIHPDERELTTWEAMSDVDKLENIDASMKCERYYSSILPKLIKSV